MGRLVTIVTGGFADLTLDQMCALAQKMGYDGLELACWGNLLDPHKAATDMSYVDSVKETLAKYDDCVNEMYGIIEREIFAYGFRLGGRFMLETLTGLNFED